MDRPCSRQEAAELDETYDLVLDCEMYHDHELMYDEHDTLRWKADPTIKMLRDMEMIDLNAMVLNLAREFGDRFKNDPRMRDLYRRMGYSLSGYWEVFYWEANNERANEWIIAADQVTSLKEILTNLRDNANE